ncbi:MAG: hypothetical protein Q8P49_00440 [Candidatus Liptonbacteria bacterium]|nr:hypothetical protein [Candidatus Liptonbacteria bacterium]
MIKKIKNKYVVLSENTVRHGSRQARRKFGTYKTLAEAKKRLRQIEFFKHLKARGKR